MANDGTVERNVAVGEKQPVPFGLPVVLRLVGAAIAVLVAGDLARADFQFQDWWFDRDQAGHPPSGLVPGSVNLDSGRWAVKADPHSPASPNGLAHRS